MSWLKSGKRAPESVDFSIDGQPRRATPGTTLLEAANAAGIWIPNLCHLSGKEPRESCRLCVVKVRVRTHERRRWPRLEEPAGLVPACSVAVRSGMVVETSGSEVDDVRRTIMELIFGDHGECGRADCELEALAARLGVRAGRFGSNPKPAKPGRGSESIHIAIDDCVVCDRCIRVCPLQVIDRGGRGASTYTLFDGFLDLTSSRCNTCGDCVAVCPSGALRIDAPAPA